MTQIETLEGTLGFEVGDPITSRVAGTLTYAPEAGVVLVEGDVLYAVDLQPVVLMYGDLPAFQTIARVPDTADLVIRAGGTVTAVVAEGETIAHGGVIAEVDEMCWRKDTFALSLIWRSTTKKTRTAYRQRYFSERGSARV